MIRVLEALADERRLAILDDLREGELTAGEIAGRFDVRRPTISHHLSVLHAAGLVDVRREGTRRLYSLRPEPIGEVVRYLGRFWDERLERLRSAAEGERGGRN